MISFRPLDKSLSRACLHLYMHECAHTPLQLPLKKRKRPLDRECIGCFTAVSKPGRWMRGEGGEMRERREKERTKRMAVKDSAAGTSPSDVWKAFGCIFGSRTSRQELSLKTFAMSRDLGIIPYSLELIMRSSIAILISGMRAKRTRLVTTVCSLSADRILSGLKETRSRYLRQRPTTISSPWELSSRATYYSSPRLTFILDVRRSRALIHARDRPRRGFISPTLMRHGRVDGAHRALARDSQMLSSLSTFVVYSVVLRFGNR